jgi:hypothetical protein
MAEAERPGSVSDVVGAPTTIDWRGAKYTVGRPTPDVLSDVEEAVAKNAVKETKALVGVLDPADVPDITAALLARHHRVGGPLWQAAFKTAAGLLFILWACIKRHHPEFAFTDAMALAGECPLETKAALALVAPDFFALAGEQMGTPPEKTRAAAAALLAALSK